MQADTRFVLNPFAELWRGVEASHSNISDLFLQHLLNFQKSVPVPSLQAISSDPNETHEDYSMFEGSSSYLYLYIRLHRFFKVLPANVLDRIKTTFKYGDEAFYKLTDAKLYLEKAVRQHEQLLSYVTRKKEKRLAISFCMGKGPVYLCGAHLGCLTNNVKLFRESVQELLKYHATIMSSPYSWQTEVLYGVPGFLYMLLELQSFYQPGPHADFTVDLTNEVTQLVEVVINTGLRGYTQATGQHVDIRRIPPDFRLVYLFSDSEYLGGAHGLAGALNMIFISLARNRLPQELIDKIILTTVPSVDYLLKQQTGGNIPPRAKSKSAKLVQFCHGAPGIVTPLLYFSLLFPDHAKRLKVGEHLETLFEHIWQFGIIKKGYYGLCHGISGNAYQFISPICRKVLPHKIQEYTKKASLMWLLQLDEKIMTVLDTYPFEDRFFEGISDYPFSMMLGRAGDLCFCCDLLIGEGGRFPGYDV